MKTREELKKERDKVVKDKFDKWYESQNIDEKIKNRNKKGYRNLNLVLNPSEMYLTDYYSKFLSQKLSDFSIAYYPYDGTIEISWDI